MTDRQHIAHIIYRFDTGGLENGVVNLINHLGAEAYRHTIITMTGHCDDFAARIKTGNVDFVDLGKKPGQDLGMFLRLNKLLKQLRPDVLHTRNTATLECQVIGWWNRVPLRVHGEHGWDMNDMHGQNVTYQRLRRLMRPFIHQYVALSTEARDYLLNTIRVTPQKVNHICNGVDDSKFHPSEETSQSAFVFGCVGRLEKVKNHQLLAHAFVKCLRDAQIKGRDVRLVIVGDGGCREQIEQIFIDNQCQDAVYLAGNRSDVAEQMRGFDAFVLPSLAEGISNTILEAMATGLPVIATDVGGNGDLIDNSETGYLVPTEPAAALAEKMSSYVEHPEIAKAHGLAGRRKVERRFSIEVMKNAYADVYQQAGQ